MPPLPRELAESLRLMRRLRPPEALVERAMTRLPEQVKRLVAAGARRRRTARWGLATPALVALALTALLWARGGAAGPALERFEEQSVELPDSGTAWTHLDLWTDRHAGQTAVMDVEVPENVRVRLPDGRGGALERRCEFARCVHQIVGFPGDGAPLNVALDEPGRYEIHVRHESNEARVSERFVLIAERN
ncbi:hypothetical protein WMF37_26420 [Sorangium sp. So ce291]|uniref:hypothetical protein n=1 Tax=Sorangium sp. So ce291 TaxID=3133294 RepID=UPI003F5E2612